MQIVQIVQMFDQITTCSYAVQGLDVRPYYRHLGPYLTPLWWIVANADYFVICLESVLLI